MRYISKQFLNDCYGESGSMVCAFSTPTMEHDSYNLREEGWFDGDITFRDCSSRPVNIDLSGKFKDFDKRIAKVDFMIEELQKLKKSMKKGKAEMAKGMKKYKKEHGR